MRIAEVIVIYDVGCPNCSAIARELPELVRAPVKVRSCRDPQLPSLYRTLPVKVRGCGAPAVGTVRPDGSVRWWPGLTGALGLLPVLRVRRAFAAFGLLWTAFRVP
jgi:hypothetical protein